MKPLAFACSRSQPSPFPAYSAALKASSKTPKIDTITDK
jgi:hypothetical protein